MGLARRISFFVTSHKVPFAAAGCIAAAAVIGVILWASGILGSDQEPSAEAAPVSAATPEPVGDSPAPAAPISLVTAVPGHPACSRSASASGDNSQPEASDISDIEDVALSSVVQILTDTGAGSGFVADPAGIVVTDAQVVSGSWFIKVRLATGETVEGELFGINEKLGIAYIEIAADEALATIPLGNSDEVCAGDGAFAAGYMEDQDSSVTTPSITQGMISSSRKDFLWIDVLLKPGGAGGPLLDATGKVIGVNSSGIVVRDGNVTATTNFAIPINGIKQQIDGGLDRGQLSNAIRSAPRPTSTPKPTPATR